MRTNLLRSFFGGALLVAVVAATALAQPPARGTVVDATGKPVQDAVVQVVAQFGKLQRQAKTDSKGEFLMVGLPSGEYKSTATKDGVGTSTITQMLTQGQNPLM